MRDVTVVIPTSPVPAHPSTAIIERVIASIKSQLPGAPILILCDGVREELKHRGEQYRKYIMLLGTMGLHPLIFGKHMQQSGMLQMVLELIQTPFLFFCEHDAVVDDKPIDWDAIFKLLSSGEANMVRLYWNSVIHPEHEYLMRGRAGDFVKTIQFSGWPFITRTDFFRNLMTEFFPPDSKKMIETTLYSPFVESPWERFKTWIYAPTEDAVRFHHLNSRVDPETNIRDFGDW